MCGNITKNKFFEELFSRLLAFSEVAVSKEADGPCDLWRSVHETKSLEITVVASHTPLKSKLVGAYSLWAEYYSLRSGKWCFSSSHRQLISHTALSRLQRVQRDIASESGLNVQERPTSSFFHIFAIHAQHIFGKRKVIGTFILERTVCLGRRNPGQLYLHINWESMARRASWESNLSQAQNRTWTGEQSLSLWVLDT